MQNLSSKHGLNGRQRTREVGTGRVSKLDIDDYGSIIALKELELKIPANDNSIIQTWQNSSYAAIFTEGDTDDNNSTIILANGITIEELNKEKSKTIDKVVNKK
jgi:hypothetical protein